MMLCRVITYLTSGTFFMFFLQLIKQNIEDKTYRIARAEKYFNRKLSKALKASTALFSIGNGKERENLTHSQTSNMNQTLLTLVTNPRCQKITSEIRTHKLLLFLGCFS